MRSLGERTGFRSSRSQTSNLVLESLFDKALGLKACNSIKKSLGHRCFPMKFAKFLRTAFFTSEFQWLLLFSNKFEAKTGATVGNKYQIQLKKCICCRENPEAATASVLKKKGFKGFSVFL